MNPYKYVILLFISVFGIHSLTLGAILAGWDTSSITGGVTPGPSILQSSESAANLTASDITVGAGLSPHSPTDGGRFQFTGFAGSTTDSLSGGSYFEFTLTPASGYQFSLTDFTLSFRGRAGTATATDLMIYSSLNGYSSSIATVNLPDGNSQLNFTNEPISGVANTSSAVTFRMTLGTDSTGRPWAITNSLTGSDFILNGSVSAVPEPSLYAAVFGFIVMGAVLYRRRKLVPDEAAK